ncbi:MAG TPA: hypothetical protein VGC41_02155 [Kofleriaceae bacterium]
MQLIARVEAQHGVHFVRVAPINARFETNVRPRPAAGELITITFAGLPDVNVGSFDLWRDLHAPNGEIDRRFWRPTVLADLMTAANAELWLGIDRTADELVAFANDRGGALLALIRTELASTHEVIVPTQQARRFAAILRVPFELELEPLHPIEQLMALEHAVVSWMREPPSEVAALARELPTDSRSAGASKDWLRWWWRLARAITARELRAAVAGAIDIARIECARDPSARAAIAEAVRMAERAARAPRAEAFADPPGTDVLRDDEDAHYASYMAVTHAAHAIAAALRDEMAEANAQAMRLVATAALAAIK